MTVNFWMIAFFAGMVVVGLIWGLGIRAMILENRRRQEQREKEQSRGMRQCTWVVWNPNPKKHQDININ